MEEGYLYSFYINVFDIVVIFILLLSAILAYYRGFMREFLGVFAWLFSFYLTLLCLPWAGGILGRHTENGLAAYGFAAAGIFVLLLITLSLVNAMLIKYINTDNMSGFDRAAGFLFGLLRGYLLIALGYLGFSLFVPPSAEPSWMKEARTRRLMVIGAQGLESLSPDVIRKYRSKQQKLEEEEADIETQEKKKPRPQAVPVKPLVDPDKMENPRAL